MVLDIVNIKNQNKNGHATWTKELLQISTWDKRNIPAKYVYVHAPQQAVISQEFSASPSVTDLLFSFQKENP